MSRIGKRAVAVPKGVSATLTNGVMHVKGPKGELTFNVDEGRYPAVAVAMSDGSIAVTRREESRRSRTEQGLVRALIQNMVHGVTENFSRIMDIVGVGYRAEVKGESLSLALGYSHPIDFEIPKGIKIAVDKQTRITVSGADRQLVGETAARIRRLRPPEPYKGKGIRYADEVVRRKVGKAAAGATTGG
jgi:large subunit ribosomal protein L6